MNKSDLVKMGIDGSPEKLNLTLATAGFGVIIIIIVALVVGFQLFGTPVP